MNTKNKENMHMGDFSSNLNGFLGNKDESGRAKANESHEKNIGLENTGEEDKN